MIVTRFAPSPTGNLHIGNIRTAILSWMYARRAGGRFVLRIDDTDRERSEERYVESIRADLAWLGLTPDAEVRQSERFALYEKRFEELRAAGRVYPAYETAQELDLKRKVQLGRGLPPIYDRAALALSDAERAKLEADGVRPHWRFKLDPGAIEWDDLIRGHQHFDAATMSDPVIRRADGSWLYMLPSAIDDIDLGDQPCRARRGSRVEHRAADPDVRGDGRAVPTFAHAALLTGAEGKLSKRLGSLGAEHFRDEGIEPQAIVSLLARIGTSDPVEPFADPAPLIAAFDFCAVRPRARAVRRGRARASERADRPPARLRCGRRSACPRGWTAAGWEAIRPNLSTIADAADWWHVVEGPVAATADPEDRDFLAAAHRIAGDDRLGERPLARADRRAEGRDRAQGQAAVPAAAPRADRARSRSRHGGLAPADRPRARVGTARRQV